MFSKGYNELLKDFIVSEVGKKGVLLVQSYKKYTTDSTQEPLQVEDWIKEEVGKVCTGHQIFNYNNTSIIIDVNNLELSKVIELMKELITVLMWNDNWSEPYFYNGHNFLNMGAVSDYGIDLKYDKKCLSRSDIFYSK